MAPTNTLTSCVRSERSLGILDVGGQPGPHSKALVVAGAQLAEHGNTKQVDAPVLELGKVVKALGIACTRQCVSRQGNTDR